VLNNGFLGNVLSELLSSTMSWGVSMLTVHSSIYIYTRVSETLYIQLCMKQNLNRIQSIHKTKFKVKILKVYLSVQLTLCILSLCWDQLWTVSAA